MRRNKKELLEGQSLIEILFSIAIFIVGIVTVGYLLIESQTSLGENRDFTQAHYLAIEGIEAARTIRDRNFGELEEGTSGVSFAEGTWSFNGNESDVSDIFTRSITIEDVDDRIKKVTSNVVWMTSRETEEEVSLTTYVSDWKQTNGKALSLRLREESAVLVGESLSGVTLENDSGTALALTDMAVSWSGSETIESLTIDGSVLFSASTSSSAPPISGETFDIEDYFLLSGTGERTVDELRFSGPISASEFIMTFFLDDGSTKNLRISL